ncbi:hypothetical protein [Stutzerimonas xanthomarina]|uniref:hypothetical protein n=1 Tax=Stutzerimonas xanthomarina TaxID=271420 RepID=UPI003AA7E486
MVSWDTKLHTAISDLEVENHDEKVTSGTCATRWPTAARRRTARLSVSPPPARKPCWAMLPLQYTRTATRTSSAAIMLPLVNRLIPSWLMTTST